jgi:hypothetical protein
MRPADLEAMARSIVYKGICGKEKKEWGVNVAERERGPKRVSCSFVMLGLGKLYGEECVQYEG